MKNWKRRSAGSRTICSRRIRGWRRARWIALRLLDGDERITEAVRTGKQAELSAGAG